VNTEFGKNYLCDSGALAYNKPVFQEFIKATYITHGLKFYLKSWASQPAVRDHGKLGGSEWDPVIAGIVFPIWKFVIDAGYGYYWLGLSPSDNVDKKLTKIRREWLIFVNFLLNFFLFPGFLLLFFVFGRNVPRRDKF